MTIGLVTNKLNGPPAHGRRERRRQETRERIFRAAMKLFAERGFFATTVEDITEAADVGKGTFFNYFPSKEHVLGVLHDIQLSKIAEAHAAALQGRKRIHDVLQELARRITEEPGRSQLLARSLLSTLLSSDAVRNLMADIMARGRCGVAAVIAIGQERGEIRRELNADEAALGFQQCMLGTVLLWSINPPSSLEKRLKTTFDLYWDSVRSSTREAV